MVVAVQRSALRGHFVFSTVQKHPRFVNVTTYSPQNHVHQFRLTALSDVDATFKRWVAKAYRVGQQRHLESAQPGEKRGRLCHD